MNLQLINYSILFYIIATTIASAVPSRELNALSFPQVERTNDMDDILDEYPVYLNFVLEIGRETDPVLARKLQETYAALTKYFPKAAAYFLKGLRFEMVQRLELSGRSPRSISTRNGDYRRFVSRYLKAWLHEADEHYFRARVSSLISRRASSE